MAHPLTHLTPGIPTRRPFHPAARSCEGEPLSDFLVRQNTDAERRLTLDILVECDLGTRKQADRNMRLADRRKTTSNRVVEVRRHQLVLDLGGPVRD
jgi:hypothetical protein